MRRNKLINQKLCSWQLGGKISKFCITDIESATNKELVTLLFWTVTIFKRNWLIPSTPAISIYLFFLRKQWHGCTSFLGYFFSSRWPGQIGPSVDFVSATIPPPIFSVVGIDLFLHICVFYKQCSRYFLFYKSYQKMHNFTHFRFQWVKLYAEIVSNNSYPWLIGAAECKQTNEKQTH